MARVKKIFVILASIECFVIMLLEMFFWEQVGMKINPAMTVEFLTQTVTMAANQGLYNGFLGLGIVLGLIRKNKEMILFSLACMIMASIYGAYSVDYMIIFKQGIIPLIALILMLLVKDRKTTLHFRTFHFR